MRQLSRLLSISSDESVLSALILVIAKFLTTLSNNYFGRFKKRYLYQYLASRKISPTHEVIIIHSYISYAHPMKQRPQHIADSLARNGQLVIYLTPTKNGRGDLVFGIKKVSKNLYISDTILPFLDYFETSHVLLYSIDINLSWPLYKLLKTHHAKVIYDYMDMLDDEHFLKKISDPKSFLKLQKEILESKDSIVLASSDLLLEESQRYRPNVYLVPNACNPVDFKSTKDLQKINSRMKDIIALQKPIIGFVGGLACWIDYDLIEKIALHNQSLLFVLIGPSIDESSLNLQKKQVSNLFFIGTVPFSQLKHYTTWFDASLVPFRIVELTDAVSPVKLFEYMAVGKPIIGTKTKEMKKYKSVLFINDANDFTKKIADYLKKNNDKSYLKVLEKELKENSWDDRAKKILTAINDAK